MLDISWGELLLIGAVALIVIGPKELPTVLRTVGQWMTKLRRMANEFQGQFQEAIREAEIADLKKEVDDMTDKAKSYANFDPIGDVRKDIENTFSDKPVPAADKPAEVAAAPETAALEKQAEMAAAAEVPLADRPTEVTTTGTTSIADTPADVVAPVEAAMRAVAEMSAPQPEAAVPPAWQNAEASALPADTRAPTVTSEPLPAPAAPAPVSPSAPPAPAATAAAPAPPVLDEDGWPVPASFKDPLGPKRGSA